MRSTDSRRKAVEKSRLSYTRCSTHEYASSDHWLHINVHRTLDFFGELYEHVHSFLCLGIFRPSLKFGYGRCDMCVSILVVHKRG
jgi:hypothetical protein